MADDSDKPAQVSDGSVNETAENHDEELIDLARQFLQDDAIKTAPREDKIEFLKEKGLPEKVIDQLLSDHAEVPNELKTIHDTTNRQSDAQQVVSASTESPNPYKPSTFETKKEMAPIITYPEFLLKPQKPPPLITVPRLVNATYALAGVTALTWSVSKYLVEPMLQTLTEARHDFAGSVMDDLGKLNTKLEGTVSHVPYIASSAVKNKPGPDDDVESIDSDPTELFHRDIATQTTPGLSRSSSDVSLTRHTLDPTVAQSERIAGLSYSLRSLIQSMDRTTDNEQYLQKTVKGFQQKLDNLESNYSLLKNDYYGSASTYSSASKDAKKNAPRESEAQKFKQEIRGLKGVFLSSRNFPTATR